MTAKSLTLVANLLLLSIKMTKSIKKYNIKIPKDITVIYCKKKRTLTFLGPIEKKSKKLKTQIFINHDKKIISVSPILFSQSSNTEKKKNSNDTKHYSITNKIYVNRKFNIAL